jgi:hypothetical protein
MVASASYAARFTVLPPPWGFPESIVQTTVICASFVMNARTLREGVMARYAGRNQAGECLEEMD